MNACREYLNYIGAGHIKGLKTVAQWWNYMLDYNPEEYDRSNVMVGIEQAQNRSHKEKYCVECGSPDNLVEQNGVWIYGKYYMCQDCIDRCNKKNS